MAKKKAETAKGKIVKITLSEAEKNSPELAKGRVSGDYIVKENESDVIHVELETTQFNATSGVKKSSPAVRKMNERAWLNFKKHCKGLGFNHVRVLYAPEGVDTKIVDPRQPKEEKAEK